MDISNYFVFPVGAVKHTYSVPGAAIFIELHNTWTETKIYYVVFTNLSTITVQYGKVSFQFKILMPERIT